MSYSSLKRVFFYCCPESTPERQGFHHAIVCIAEGLRVLGISCYGNRNYWKSSPNQSDYLIQYDETVTPDDCDLVIMEMEWFSYGYPLPTNLFHKGRCYKTVYFELHEQLYSFTPEFRQFDSIFRGYYNTRMNYPSNIKPWGFGLSKRILKEAESSLPYVDRDQEILVNFRHSAFMHSVRKNVETTFLQQISHQLGVNRSVDGLQQPPNDEYHHLQWVQTGKRHYPSYYQRLRRSAACACFGGFFVPSFPRDQRHILSRLSKKLMSRWGLKTNTVLQWDSWRFWEALVTGCVAFHIDLEKYGCALPVMPENWKHYIGVDLDNVQATIDRLQDEPEILAQISAAGREWAIEHYAPVPTAIRFLETVFPNHQDLGKLLRNRNQDQKNQVEALSMHQPNSMV